MRDLRVVSVLKNAGGLYSSLFFVLNHYMYCKQYNTNFKIKSSEWLYKSILGWNDYFENVELHFNDCDKPFEIGHSETLEYYSIRDYQNIIPEVYVYNEPTKNEIKNAKLKFNLNDGEYDSIYIRRGDKLGAESTIILEQQYIKLLLEINPNCKTIYLQTDDYNCFITLQQYIQDNKLNIQLHTNCDKDSVGTIVQNTQKTTLNDAVHNNESNKAYLSTIIDKLNNTTPIDEMNCDEKYKHTMNIIVGVDLVLHSNICITDYQSNVSRFIKLAHTAPQNVHDVRRPHQDIDYSAYQCPAYEL